MTTLADPIVSADTARIIDDWFYVRAYPGRLELMDEATRVLVPWLKEAASGSPAPRWFFMRYLDMTGQHLRLRVRCTRTVADQLYAQLPDLLAMIRGLAGAGSGPRLVPGAALGPPGLPRVRISLYAPELRKYGGTAGTAIAEELFTDASDWYLRNGVVDLDPRTARAALAIQYLRSAVARAMPGSENEFWTAHRRQWSRHLRIAATGQDPIRRLLRDTSQALATATTLDPRLVDSVTTHASTVGAALDAVERLGVDVGRLDLLINYLHMDMNRWGFLPAEECLLGMLASARQPVPAGLPAGLPEERRNHDGR